jgi:hypothetical protein
MLYIKWSLSTPNDAGEPMDDPGECWPPNKVWNNASIWMERRKNDTNLQDNEGWDAANVEPTNEATIGKVVKIYVAAYTSGASFVASPGVRVKAQVWVCDCTTGLGPKGAISPGGEAGMPMSYSSPITKTPEQRGVNFVMWTPKAGDLRNADPNDPNRGHLCIGANLYWMGSSPPAEGVLMPPPSELDICNNRHHGQKNIGIVKLKMDEELAFFIEVPNPGPEGPEEEFRVELAERLGAGAIGRLEKEALITEDFVALAGGRPRKVRRRKLTAEEAAELGAPDGATLPMEPEPRARLAGGGRLVLAEDRRTRLYTPRNPLDGARIGLEGSDRGGRELRVAVAPRKPEVIELRLPADRRVKPGATRFFDVVQRRQGGGLVGGMTVGVVRLP